MTAKIKIQDYLFSSAIALKAIAILITLHSLHKYPCLLCEKNPVAALFVQSDWTFLLSQLAVFAFICFGYYSVRSKYLEAHKMTWIRWSFNTLVGFVFLTYFFDAANDAVVLLTIPSAVLG